MEEYLEKIPAEIKDLIKVIKVVSLKTRMPAYLVGGFVRDSLLGVENYDLDVTVAKDAILFAERLAAELKCEVRAHERFKTATLFLVDRLKLDVATMRKEKYPYPASLPQVSPGSLIEDLKRRDFTINAMAINITPGQKQQLIDPFGGQDDLRKARIRILHDLSFQDDPTRILRAVRFEQRFGFKIENKTLKLLKEAVSFGALSKVKASRLGDELILMLKEADPAKPLERLDQLAGLSFISPELKFNPAQYRLFRSIGRQLFKFQRDFPRLQQPESWLVYFLALVKPLDLSEIKKITRKFGLRKNDARKIIGYCSFSQKIDSELSKPGLAPAEVFSLLSSLSQEALIFLVSCSRNKYLKKNIFDFLRTYNGVRIFVSGKDLHNLGVVPGPVYQEVLAKVLIARLNGEVVTLEDELILLRELVKHKGLKRER